jgi:hypothetical protein
MSIKVAWPGLASVLEMKPLASTAYHRPRCEKNILVLNRLPERMCDHFIGPKSGLVEIDAIHDFDIAHLLKTRFLIQSSEMPAKLLIVSKRLALQ